MMMKITMKPASLMVGTAVEPMSIHITAQNVYALNEEVVEQIREDGIHILMDLQGHSQKNRLPIFMYKAAPIQASWLSQGSTGIPEIDYFIGSSHLTPKEEEHHYVEKVWRLPEISQCFTPPDFQVEIKSIPAIKNKYITFGSVNKLTKGLV